MISKCELERCSQVLKIFPSPCVSRSDSVRKYRNQFPETKMWHTQDDRQRWTLLISKIGMVLCLFIASLACPTLATMEITAFEYNRKFHGHLSLGECCQREQAVNMGNNSYYIEKQKCSLQRRGTISNLSQEISDTRNVLITSAEAVVPLLGLCGGEAASFLGILYSGDCVAIEMASRLSFTDKTMVRGFIGKYQKYLESLDDIGSNLEGMDRYYKDKYYLQSRSYGTLEIVLVQFRFESTLSTQEAKKIKMASLQMSAYMRQIRLKVGLPKFVVVISLSTANQETYQFQQFKREDWDRALRYVEILENGVQRTLIQIRGTANKYHLMYQLQPFLVDKDYRLASPALWENISKLEVLIRQAISIAKKTARKCKGNKMKLCRRVRELKIKLTNAQSEVHDKRANWINMKPEEKSSLAALYTANVQSYSSLTKNLAKSVNEMTKKKHTPMIMTTTETVPDTFNQIPRHTEERIQRRQRRMRHFVGRNTES